MKTLKLKNFICRVSLLILLISTTIQIQAQVINGPGMHWSKDHWLGMETEPQSESGEDWYYDFVPYLEDESLDGYAGFGFSSYVNDNGDFECFNCGVGDVSPEHLERSGYEVGCNYPKIAEMDKLGNIEWYEVYTKGFGAFRAGVQLKDESGYVAVGYLKYEGLDGIQYNPGIIGEGDELPLLDCDPDPVTYNLLYIVRTDEEGELQAEAVYGFEPSTTANIGFAQAYGIIQDAEDDDLVVTGFVFESGIRKAFLMKIDKDDLSISWSKTIIDAGLYSSIGTAVIEHEDYYYVAGTKLYDDATPGHGKINIVKFNSGGTEIEDFEINYTTTGDTDIDEHTENCLEEELSISNCVAYKMIINDDDLLVASLVKRADDVQSIKAEALGKVYRINLSGSMSWENTVLVVESPADRLVTFDLKMGITNTFDGGYAITTSKHISDLYVDCNDSENITYYPGTTESFSYEWTRVWNADAYIAKFSSSDAMEWNATYPITDGYGTYFPNDIKHMECVYQILEAEDHGLIIAGNNSKNFDDDLVIKTYNDCSIYTEYTGTNDIESDLTISTNTTWSSSRKVKGIVTITTGHSLTITGSSTVIEFADSKASNVPTYIIVERGAKLQVDGGAILTGNTECGTMWDGIMVYGTNGNNQPSVSSIISYNYFDNGGDHGVVRIITGSTIENARYGIFAGKYVGNFINSSYGGGIVIAESANFINNSIDVYFSGFNKSNRSLLRNCNFTTDAILLDEIENPITHVFLGATKNINIRGCDFENSTTTDDYPESKRGKGIFSNNSYFKVDDSPDGFGTGGTGSNPNSFTDLTYGIYAIATEVGANIIEVNKNTFDNNVNGFYLSGSTLSETNQNTFIVRPANSAYGLYLDGCTAYDVQENIFTKDEADLYVTIGMIINNSGTGDNLVYKNSFSNLKEGSIALKK